MERFGEGQAGGIFIQGLNVHARHGLLDHQAQLRQRFVIDIDQQVDLSDAASSDDTGQTIDYAPVVATATEAFLASRHVLLERAAAATAVRITAHKPQAPITAIFEDVGIRLTRYRADRHRRTA
ncbi:dihydroneopterin aldolase [Tardiphaga sp. 619_E2_N8_5]|jgi:dihydroneopterin aldolase|uniref:dihydroneopterin aldolase n=1 Tax=unclassified Tardiphaga TaxID=2631404 RepID=UPI003F236454